MDWASAYSFRKHAILAGWAACLGLLSLSGCASVKGILGGGSANNQQAISNPFANYRRPTRADSDQNIILRTKKGDRSVEIEIPGDTDQISDFVIPISPAFKDTASVSQGGDSLDERYAERSPSASDREITGRFPQGLPEDDARRDSIEKGLYLSNSKDEMTDEKSQSYLAGLDKVKQLYRIERYEAALLETDSMIKIYPTDAKLHEMRGTLLDRMGRRELAMKSWGQSLRFNPKNESLKRFMDRKSLASRVSP